MNDLLKNIDEKDMEELFDPVIRQRGYEYFERGNVINLVSFENKIMATVAGTANYITSIEIKDNELHISCTCPYEGNCKHAAALMYAWMKRRKDFIDMEEILNRLKKMDKEEIISVIKEAIYLNPNNFVFLAPFDEKAMKRKIDNLFEHEYPFYGPSFLASELKNLLPRIKRNKENATTFLEYIVFKMIDYDFEEELEDIVDSYVDALKEEIRVKIDEKLIERYFNYYMEKNDFDEIIPSILLDVCSEEQLKFLEHLAREEENEKTMKILVGIYEKLEEREKFVDVAMKLIQHQYSKYKSFDEEIIEKLIEIGETKRVIEFLEKCQTEGCMYYLIIAYEKEGNIDRAYEISRELLKQSLYPDLIAKLRKYAKEKGEWEEVKNEIVRKLRNGGLYDEIIKFALEEEDVETIMAYVHRCKNADLLEKVSKFIDERNDVVALRKLIEMFIERGGRENYMMAVDHLIKLKEKLLASGKIEEWNVYLEYIKKRYRKKYGLILEIEKRGLKK